MKNTKLLVLFFTIVLFAWGLWRFWDILDPFVTAVILAFLLTPLSSLLVKKLRFAKLLAVLVTVFIIFGLIITLLSLIASYAVGQVSNLIADISSYAKNYDQLVAVATDFLEGLHMPQTVISTVKSLLQNSDSYIASFVQSLVSGIITFSSGIIDVVIIIILTIYFMLDGNKIIDFIADALTEGLGGIFKRSLSEISSLTWKYFRSRVILSFGMAVVTFLGLTIMGIKYAVLFALISFVLDFIPYFGSIIAAIIEVFYALISKNLGIAIAVGVFVIIVQQIEGNVVAPKMQGEATGLHPIVIMFALLACNQIWGPMGMLISTPIAIIFKVILREVRLYLVSDDGKKTAV
ncbi:MAG: AI-2E family transporter [Clostridia bacterium]|nr:AI-2E family transporter [Clostridia bacterium]